MERGFKARAERTATRLRTELDASADSPIDLHVLAARLGVEVRSATDLVPKAELEELNRLQPGAFSAATFTLPGRVVAVLNPVGTIQARTRSDLAHELAHVILGHDLRTVEHLGSATFFTCDPNQEDEANWLAGCLLLPRPLLLAHVRAGGTAESLAEKHTVSLPMARYRLNASGVILQARRTTPNRTSPAGTHGS